jgi:hypothetical protein
MKIIAEAEIRNITTQDQITLGKSIVKNMLEIEKEENTTCIVLKTTPNDESDYKVSIYKKR